MRLRRLAGWLVALAAVGLILLGAAFGAARWLTRDTVPVPEGYQPSAERGALLAAVGGCANCHTAEGADAEPLAGGRALETPFGTFYGPNITPHPEQGIGGWTEAEFLAALSHGVAPDGSDYYPAFPYTSFTAMTAEDMLDIRAWLMTQPASARPSLAPDLGFPFSVRQGVTFWKVLNLSPGPLPAEPERDEAWHRGRYLAAAVAHCGECHTPRDAFGGTIHDLAFSGSADGPTGDAIPNITPDRETGIGIWSESDLAFFLQSGMTPGGDFAGGEMSEVIRGTSQLSADDRAAIAAYVMSLPPIANQVGPVRAAAPEGDGEVWD